MITLSTYGVFPALGRTAVLLSVGRYVVMYLDDNPSDIAVELQRDWGVHPNDVLL